MMSRFIRSLAVLSVFCTIAAPARLVAQGADSAGVPLAARDLARGTVLEAADFRFEEEDRSAGEAPIGWITRRVVTEGEPLHPPAIAPAPVVHSGDRVRLVWSRGGLELQITGKAMNSAAAGERVRVRVDTRRRFEGTALEPGLVRLDSPEHGRGR